MRTRRLIVNLVSVAVGAIVTWVVIYAYIPLGPVTLGFGTVIRKFAYSNAVILFISVAGIVWIWLDYLLGTKYLKS